MAKAELEGKTVSRGSTSRRSALDRGGSKSRIMDGPSVEQAFTSETGLEAVQKTGVSVLLLDTKSENPNHYIVLAIRAALQASPRVTKIDMADCATAVRLAQSSRYDLLLAVDGEDVNVDVLFRLRHLVGTSVLWAWEDPYERSRTIALAPLFDKIFTNDAGSTGFYPGGALHLPLAASKALPVLADDAHYNYDLAFVGSAWPNRVVFLRRLMRTLPDLRSRIVLSYNTHLPLAYLDLPESSYVGSLAHPDFLDIANRSRVNLTLHRDFSGDGVARSAQTPGPRLFEIALAGGFQLVDTRDQAIDSFYAPDRELDVFGSFDDCVDKIRQALAYPKIRMAKARAAQLRTQAEHGYTHRLDIVLDAAQPPRRAPVQSAAPVALTAARKPRLLFVTHNVIANGNFGGVEVYQEIVADQLRSAYQIFYYYPAPFGTQNGMRDYVVTDSRHKILQRVSVPDFDILTTLSHAVAENTYAGILGTYEIDLVHYHHLINHCASLPLISRMLGVPSVYTLQDFWTVCTRFNLIDHRGQYCRVADRPKTVCDVCLKTAEDRVPGAQEYRRSVFSKVLQSFDRIMGNSPTAMRVCRSVYPELTDATFVPMGLPLPWTAPREPLNRPVRGRNTLQVVFLGNFTRAKGAETFLEAAALTVNDDIVFIVCGRVDAAYADRLAHPELRHVTVEGGFTPGHIDLARFDVSLHLSIWPETYCITLSEAWKAGVVPIVTACGALSDRVSHEQDGFLVPIDGSGEIVLLLRRLQADRRELEQVSSRISSHLWITPQQHCATLAGVYAGLIAAHPQLGRPAQPGLGKGAPTTLALSPHLFVSPDWTQPDTLHLPEIPPPGKRSMSPLQRELGEVRHALATGLVESITGMLVHIDGFGSLLSPSVELNGLVKWSPIDSPQLSGWVQFTECVPNGLMLAVRSAAGDLILRQVFLHDRPDLPARSQDVRLGFLTETFPQEMLEDAIYGLEFVVLQGGILHMLALPAALNGTLATLTTQLQAMPRMLIPGTAWQPLPALPLAQPHGAIDEVVVRNLARKTERPAHALFVHGWMTDPSEGITAAPVALQLRGKQNFHIPLEATPRPDVLSAMRFPVPEGCGVEGRAWLGDLPAGDYDLGFVKRLAGGVVYFDGARLHVPGDTAAPFLVRDDAIDMKESPNEVKAA